MLQSIGNIALATPALMALSVQLWLIINSDKRRLINNNWPIILFFSGVIGISFIEFCTYAGLIESNLMLMKLFYVFVGVSFSGLLILSIQLSGITLFKHDFSKAIIIVINLIFSYVMVSTDLMVTGIVSIGYSVTRIPGDFYILTQLYASALILSSFYFLFVGARQKANNSDKKRSKVLLISTTPFLFIFLLLVILMALKVNLNASVIVPLATTYMLLVLILTEQKENLFSFLLKIPYTSENKSYKNVTSKIEDFLTNTNNGEEVSLKTLTSSIEKEIISIAVQMAGGSQARAATLLNTSASSICRKKAET